MALPELPDGYTKEPDEVFAPLVKGDRVPQGYFAGPDEPELPSPLGGQPYYWWDTNPTENCVKQLANDPTTGVAAVWKVTDRCQKYVVDENNSVIGKMVKDPNITGRPAPEALDPRVSYQDALRIAREGYSSD